MDRNLDKPRHFAMMREFHLADFFTLGNAACGVGSVFLAMRFLNSGEALHFLLAAALLPLAFVLAFAGRQGNLGANLYGGSWTIGPWVLHPLALLFALSGTLMISKSLRIPKL